MCLHLLRAKVSQIVLQGWDSLVVYHVGIEGHRILLIICLIQFGFQIQKEVFVHQKIHNRQ